MQGDNPDFRDRIRANGATLPTAELLQSASPNVCCTAAWALSNFARGPDPKLPELFGVGVGVYAAQIIIASGGRVAAQGDEGGKALALLIEVAWLLSYLTHNQEEFHRVLAANGCPFRLIFYFLLISSYHHTASEQQKWCRV